jgi:hypothetical protein
MCSSSPDDVVRRTLGAAAAEASARGQRPRLRRNRWAQEATLPPNISELATL